MRLISPDQSTRKLCGFKPFCICLLTGILNLMQEHFQVWCKVNRECHSHLVLFISFLWYLQCFNNDSNVVRSFYFSKEPVSKPIEAATVAQVKEEKPSAPATTDGRVAASPLAKKMASDKGIDLSVSCIWNKVLLFLMVLLLDRQNHSVICFKTVLLVGVFYDVLFISFQWKSIFWSKSCIENAAPLCITMHFCVSWSKEQVLVEE